MGTSVSIVPDGCARRLRRRAAFSLVEVTLSIGIVAFAFIGVFGLLPTGMATFRQAMNLTVGAQIAQTIINEAQQTDFDQLITDADGTPITGANATGLKRVRYFDTQGTEVVPAHSPALSADEVQRVYYWANTRILPATITPRTDPTVTASVNLATVTVEVVNNPSNASLLLPSAAADDRSTPQRNLWSGAPRNATTHPSIQFLTQCTLVSRNK